MSDIRIEFPSAGATYSRPVAGVYEYGVYGRGSVLAGRTSRTFLDSFDTVEDAQRAYPGAVVVQGSGFVEDSFSDLPGDDDPDYSDVDTGDGEDYGW